MRHGGLAWVARSTGPLAMSRAFSILCGLATTTVWARWLPAETYGEFRTALSAISFISTFCLLGTAQAAAMAAARNQDGSLIPLLRNKMMASGVGSLGLAAAAVYYGGTYGNSPGISAGLVAAAVVFPFYNVADIWQSWVNGKAGFVEQALGRGAIALLNLGTVVAAATFGVDKLWPILAAYMIGQAVVNGVLLARAAARRTNRDVDPSILRYGHHATVAWALNGVLALDMVILNHFASAKEAAMFAIAMQLPEQLKTVFSVITQAAAPTIYRSTSVVQTWRSVRKAFWLLCGGMAVVGVAGVFFLPMIIRLLFTERYAEAAEYGKWLWLCMALTGPVAIPGYMLLATKKKFFLYAPNIGFPILQAGLYLYFASDGIQGMTTARIIASVALFLLHAVNFCMRYRFEIRRMKT